MGIKGKILFWFLAPTILFGITVAGVGYFYIHKIVKQNIFDQLEIAADELQEHIQIFLSEKKARINDFCTDGFIRVCTEKIIHKTNVDFYVSQLNHHLLYKNKNLDEESLLEVFVVDLDGKVISSTEIDQVGQDISNEAYFSKTIESGFCVNDLCHSQELGQNTFEVAKLLTVKEEASPIGIIVNRYRGNSLRRITRSGFTEEWGQEKRLKGLGETGEVYIVNRDKMMITESRFIKDAVLKQIVDTEGARTAFGNKMGMTGIYLDYRDVLTLGVSRYYEEMDWVILAEKDVSEAYAPIVRLQNFTIVIGVTGIIAIITIAVFLSAGITNPINKLVTFAHTIAKGDLTKQIKVESKGEIGYLAGSFEIMRVELVKLLRNIECAKREWESTFDSVLDIIVLYDKDHRLIRCNKTLLNKLNLKPEEIIDKKCNEVFHDKNVGLYENMLTETSRSLNSVTREMEMTCLCGVFIVSCFPRFNNEGELIGIIQVMKDITERKQVEEALRASEEKYRSLFKSTADALLVIEFDGAILDANPAACSMYGFPRGEFLGLSVRELTNPDYYHTFEAAKKMLAEGKSFSVESVNMRKDGTSFSVDIRLASLPYRCRKAIIAVVRDTTERKRTEALKKRNIFVANFSRACQDFVEVRTVLELTTSALVEHLNVSRASVWLFNGSGDLVCQKLYEQPEGIFSKGMILSRGKYADFVDAIIMSDKPVNAPDARTDTHTKEFLDDYLMPLDIFSVLDTPIKLKGKVSGVLRLEQTGDPRYWLEDEIHFANAITAQVSAAIDRITERELAEEELKASEVRLRNIIENNADGIIVLDKEKIVRFVNPAAKSIFGLKAKDLKDKLFQFPVVVGNITEIDIVRNDEEKSIVEMRAAEIKWEGEKAYLASLRDITEQRKIESEKECIYSINKIIAVSLDIREIYEGFAAEIGRHIEFDFMNITLVDEDDSIIEGFAIAKDSDSSRQNGIFGWIETQLCNQLPKEGSNIGKVIDTCIPNVTSHMVEGRCLIDDELFKKGIKSQLNFPLVYKDKAIGTINFGSKKVNNFSIKQFELLIQIAPQLSIAIVNAKLYLDTKKSEEDIRKHSQVLEKSNKELLDTQRKIERHRKELQRLFEKTVLVQEEERKNLSRELHDHTGQALVTLKTNLEIIDKLLPEDALEPREWIRDSKQFLIKTMEEVRSLSFYLRPPMLDELGLVPTIESYAKDFSTRTKIAVNVSSSVNTERLQPDLKLSFFRTIQEALTNVVKHSEAKNVQIHIYYENSKLVLSISDDGKGFDIEKISQDGIKEHAVGLLGMRERFASIGVDFQILSKEGKGTTLTAKYQINI